MGVAGNLVDLTLTELLQTMALARKSGVLELRSEQAVAWLGVRDGAIVRIAHSERAVDRASVLKLAGLEVDSPPDEIEACVWEAAVSLILGLFDWRQGSFRFDHDQDPEDWSGPEGLLLSTALSPEFLAIEGARLEDEGGAGSPDRGARAASARAAADLDPDEEEDLPTRVDDPRFAPLVESSDESGEPAVVIAVDPDLAVLEVVKSTLARTSAVVHIFQSPEDGFERLKQYVVHGHVPSLLVGEGVPTTEPTNEAPGWQSFTERVRRMVPRARVVLLRGEGLESLPSEEGGPDVEVLRCDPIGASDEQIEQFRCAIASAVGSAA